MLKIQIRRTITTLINPSNFTVDSNSHDKKVNEFLEKLTATDDFETSVRHEEIGIQNGVFFVSVFLSSFYKNKKELYEKIVSEAAK